LHDYGSVKELIVHTGQHYDDNLSAVFFEQLEIEEPAHNLGVGSGGHGYQTGMMLKKLEELLLAERPDWVLVYGDTNSTLAGALAAVKLHLPVAHIEAGLRSFNRGMPEEINRVLTDHCSDLLFAPTAAAVSNLENEGIVSEKVKLVGDVMLDAVKFYTQKAEKQSSVLAKYNLSAGQYVLATIHRAENTTSEKRLQAIIEGLTEIAQRIPVILPLHPRTKAALSAMKVTANDGKSLKLIEPCGYLDMLMLEKNAALIATDSGGVQKEAYFFRVPCVTLRDETEWVELVETGWNKVCPPLTAEEVASTISQMLGQTGREAQFYGDGKAAEKIATTLLNTI